MTTKQYKDMSEQELEAKSQELEAGRVEIKEKQMAIAMLRDERASERKVREALAGMSDADKALMRKLLES